MAVGGSKLAVTAAIGGNSLVTIAKFVAFAFTGSGSMFSEAIHSLADVLNQVLLYIGIVRSTRLPDEDYEFGYGAERHVWALMSAVGIFFLGCGFTVYHGIHALLNPEHHVAHFEWAVAVLVVSFVIEGYVLFLACRAVNREAVIHHTPFVKFVFTEADPSAVAVILEDLGACMGLILAGIALVLSRVTGHYYWDAIGSLVIGLLMGFLATWLVIRNRELLVGPSIPPHLRAKVLAILEGSPAVDEVIDMRTEVMNAETYRIKADIRFDGAALADKLEPELKRAWPQVKTYEDFRRFAKDFADDVLQLLGDEIDDIERRIQRDVPKARLLDLEAD